MNIISRVEIPDVDGRFDRFEFQAPGVEKAVLHVG